MEAPNYQTLTLAPPRIPYTKFLSLLKSKNSPAVSQAKIIYDYFLSQNVDPSFALAQYRVESQYGTAGYAKITKSWGNMLADASLCTHSIGTYSPGNGYTYAKYADVLNAAYDYANYLHNYAEVRHLETIYEVTAEWTGKNPGSPFHISYTNTIINDMTDYEFAPGDFFEVGDRMIYAGPSFDRVTGKVVQKYPVVQNKTILYKGTDGTVLKTYGGPDGDAWFLGPVQGSWTWGAIFIGTSWADPDATVVYIKAPQKDKVKNVV